jgi:lactoylglutathione lyase
MLSKTPNLTQAVPFFMVTSIQESVRFYVDGFGFKMTHEWTLEGTLQWCWLQQDGAALMLQEYLKVEKNGRPPYSPQGKLGEGVSICFMCDDAIAMYHRAVERGLKAKRPFVGNGLWVTSLAGPDGYKIDFESGRRAGRD